MVTRLATWMSVLIAMTALAVPAQAQDDPGEVVERCVHAMQHSTRHTVGHINEVTESTVELIERLANGDASDERIIAAGRRGIHAASRAARRGAHHVDGIAASCIEVLREITDDRQYFRAIRRAQRAAHETIGSSREECVAAIREAVRRAIGDG